MLLCTAHSYVVARMNVNLSNDCGSSACVRTVEQRVSYETWRLRNNGLLTMLMLKGIGIKAFPSKTPNYTLNDKLHVQSGVNNESSSPPAR